MMRRIESRIDPHSADYQRFREANLERIGEFRRRQDEARFERPQRDFDRLEHHGKTFVRDRIKQLLDPGTPFLEFCLQPRYLLPGPPLLWFQSALRLKDYHWPA